MANPADVHVLYVDWAGHPAPLSECFHATGSRRLSSSVARHPRPTTEAVDNAYCPNCFAPQDKAALSRFPFCPKASCQRCPLCNGPAPAIVMPSSRDVRGGEGLCAYRCGCCTWTSQDCDLQMPVQIEAGEDGSFAVDRLELARAAEDLLLELKSRRAQGSKALEAYFSALKQSYDSPFDPHSSTLQTRIEPWNLEILQKSLEDSKAPFQSAPNTFWPTRLALKDEPWSSSDAEASSELQHFKSIPALCAQLQSFNACKMPSTKAHLMPLTTPLRTRLNRRCRAELAEGRPGIVLKPKVDPLDGDSSQRSGVGQWTKKVWQLLVGCLSCERSPILIRPHRPTGL